MSALSQVTEQLLSAFRQAGLEAVESFSQKDLPRYQAPVLALAAGQVQSGTLGMLDYLGEEVDQWGVCIGSVYGMRLELWLEMEIYAPGREGGRGCDEAVETALQVLQQKLPSGIRVQEVSWEAAEFDPVTVMFRRKGKALCRACFTAVAQEEEALLLDFKLKGVISD